jgi:transposase
MSRRSSCPQELRERAVRMVAEIRPNYETEWAAIGAVAAKLGIGSSETVRKWVRQAEASGGRRPHGGAAVARAGPGRRPPRPEIRATTRGNDGPAGR